MARLIDAESAFSFADDLKVKETGAFSKGYNKAINDMKSAFRNDDAIQTVDAQPVVHGRWEYLTTTADAFAVVKCSNCGQRAFAIAEYVRKGNYFPYCGAKMDGGDTHA